MKARDFAVQLKEEIQGLAAQGQDSIKLETLLIGLDNFLTSSAEEDEEFQIEKLKAYLQTQVEVEKYRHSANLEMFKSIIQTGQSAIKANMLLNGGAAVALLAFIGKLADVNPGNIPLFAMPLTVFVIGAFLATLVSGLAYLTQVIFSEDGKWRDRIGNTLQGISILAGLGSLILFGCGTHLAYRAFIALGG
ncbi:hypothetical protein IAE39_004965 [Pseudomonas sp. S37]|uniref:hypothetical protein n=1 Tax=Pseudomonas sp. S37 TaxID=2767449 RepID=UPI0019124534|nr:hypothetical protein [Pseudomonas sp. S37]MBK4996791.1 hypothetical protein [Pseudomonas sp. S37]